MPAKTAPTAPDIIHEEAKEDGVSAILNKRVKHTHTSLEFDPKTTFKEWQEAHQFYTALQERTNWWCGDSIRFAAEKYGEKYTQAIDLHGKEYSTLTTIVSVCERIEPARRKSTLSFGHHAEVAYLPYQEADYILDRAEKEGWNRQEVRDAVCRKQGRPTKAERDKTKADKEASKTSPAATETPSKPPKIIEGNFELLQNTPAPEPAAPPATPSEPKALPAPEPPQMQASPEYVAENRLEDFITAFGRLDISKMSALKRKSWLTRLIPVDKFIDELQRK